MIFQDALSLSTRLSQGTLRASELMHATLEQINKVNPQVNAIVSLRDGDELMAEARAAEQNPAPGWLNGIPVAIKDLANAKGLPTSMGSPVFAGQVAQDDDIMVQRLKAAGAIVIGKTNTPEFGLGSHTFNPVFGATRNAYHHGRSAGGSSGGAAVALATGMLGIADGSDMMGSLRNPAAWNNVYGMRPSIGLVPSDVNEDRFLHHLATNGPMARAPRDLAALLKTMAGQDPRLPFGLDGAHVLERPEGCVKELRLGWLADWGGALPFEAGILDLTCTALQQMEDLGCRVTPLPAPFAAEALWESWITLRSFSVAAKLHPLFEHPRQRGLLKPAARYEIERGLSLSALQVHRASGIRLQWFRKTAELFEDYDVLVVPSAQVWPFDVALVHPEAINGQPMDSYHRWMEVVIAASLLGLPVVNVPVGFGGPDDLPMGMQLIGKPQSDAMLLQLAQRWHEATGWPQKRKP